MPMKHVGFAYKLETTHKNGKPKVEHFNSYAKRKVTFFKRNGKKVKAVVTGMLYKPVDQE